MSIPKEPRQIMINLMYLVLTAMLALNVSAEIFNAFKVVNAGLVKSNASLDKINNALPAQIQEFSKKKPEFAKYAERTQPAADATQDFVAFIDGVMDRMVKETGGYVPDEHSSNPNDTRLKGYKDKDVTTRILVNDGVGNEIEKRIVALHDKLAVLFDEQDKAEYVPKLSMNVDDAWKGSRDKKKLGTI